MVQSFSTAQHSTAQHSTAQHSTAQHSTAQHSTAQHSTGSFYPFSVCSKNAIKFDGVFACSESGCVIG